MTWTSIFNAGECTIDVVYAGGGNLGWSGILAKGESSPSFPSFYGDSELVVSVDANGVVSLDVVSGPLDNCAQILVVVTSAASISGYDVRASHITMIGATGYAPPPEAEFAGSPSPTLAVPLTGSGSVWTPDPAVVTASQSPTYIGINGGVSL